jgi:DHA2 family multidrug resistance protein
VNQLAQGTGMFNLTRQLGGSMGIAIMATLLTRFTTEKKAQLTEHLTTMDPTSLGRLSSITNGLTSRGMNPATAKQQALMILDRQLQAQASVLAFSRIYILSGVILLAVLPLLFLFKTGKNRGAAGLAH